MATSKNSRRPGAPSNGGLQIVGAVRILTPLGGGTNAYVFSPVTGKQPRVEVGTEKWAEVIGELATAGHAVQISNELDTLAADYPAGRWAKAKAELVDAGVL